jgi:hypothetical protein
MLSLVVLKFLHFALDIVPSYLSNETLSIIQWGLSLRAAVDFNGV